MFTVEFGLLDVASDTEGERLLHLLWKLMASLSDDAIERIPDEALLGTGDPENGIEREVKTIESLTIHLENVFRYGREHADRIQPDIGVFPVDMPDILSSPKGM